MSDDEDPLVGQKSFTYVDGGKQSVYTPETAWDFLDHVVQSKSLAIGSCIEDIWDINSLFLIAGTGLGKTVAMPVCFWLRQMLHPKFYPNDAPGSRIEPKRAPRIWVVEPKIAIVQGLCAEMNREWRSWQRANRKMYSDLFGCKTKVDSENRKAPIIFITTGIFGIYARNGMFRPGFDVIIFDEAHDTLESDESVELGIGLCQMSGVSLHYSPHIMKQD